MMGKNKSNVSTAAGTQTKVGTIIGPGAVLNGNLTAPETIRIDGTLNGDCICEGDLILGAEGAIDGNISARSVTLSGKVTGDIKAQEKLELLPTAEVTGDITSKSLIIDENASFDGRCIMSTNYQNALSGKQNTTEDAKSDTKQKK